MASFNRVIIAGNLTRDPEYKQLASGQPVTRLGIASNRQYKNKQTGAMVQEVCFVDADVFGPQAESCRQYLQKGRGVLIEGRLKFDTWQSPEGQTRSKHSIVADRVVFLSSGQAAELDQSQTAEDAFTSNDPGVMEVQDKLSQVKAAKKAKDKKPKQESASESKNESGEFEFQDEPPFADELPF